MSQLHCVEQWTPILSGLRPPIHSTWLRNSWFSTISYCNFFSLSIRLVSLFCFYLFYYHYKVTEEKMLYFTRRRNISKRLLPQPFFNLFRSLESPLRRTPSSYRFESAYYRYFVYTICRWFSNPPMLQKWSSCYRAACIRRYLVLKKDPVTPDSMMLPHSSLPLPFTFYTC